MSRKKINYIGKEVFKTTLPNPTEEELKHLFNKKYFKLIKRIENRKLESYNN